MILNNKYTLPLCIELVIPLLEMCKEYFDTKYPCTTDDNCGDDMPINDVSKNMAYHNLLNYYESNKPIMKSQYESFLKKIEQNTKPPLTVSGEKE